MKSRSLIDLPPEIVLVILEYLSDQDVFILGLVCYKLHGIASSYLQLGKNYCLTRECSSSIIRSIKLILMNELLEMLYDFRLESIGSIRTSCIR